MKLYKVKTKNSERVEAIVDGSIPKAGWVETTQAALDAEDKAAQAVRDEQSEEFAAKRAEVLQKLGLTEEEARLI